MYSEKSSIGISVVDAVVNAILKITDQSGMFYPEVSSRNCLMVQLPLTDYMCKSACLPGLPCFTTTFASFLFILLF